MIAIAGLFAFYLLTGLLLSVVLLTKPELGDDLDTTYPYGFWSRAAAVLLFPWIVVVAFLDAEEGEGWKDATEIAAEIFNVVLNRPDPEDQE
jgi:hypothetical protein